MSLTSGSIPAVEATERSARRLRIKLLRILTTGGGTVTFATTLGAMGATTDNGDGTYQATLTSANTFGTAKVTAKLGGTSIATIGTATNSASLSVNFVFGPVSANASSAVA